MISEITAPIMNDNFETAENTMLSNDDVISTLNGLIETCKDGQEGYKQSAEGVTNSDLKTTFYEFSQQRAQFVGELQTLVRELGGDPENSGSISGAIHRGWIDLKSAITGNNDAAILNEAERGEDIAKGYYKDAAEKNLPANVLSVVHKQYQAVQSAHDKVKILRDSANKNSSATTGN
ncbi:MAG TPA: PA2169 family four-helix-bundle protein [Pyrinomonadaceae bacterium]|nr:PA2169 family four-helix-bundle protein [Pyrinomonadaceae bacterium]